MALGGVYRAVCLEVGTDRVRAQVPQLYATQAITIFETAGPRPLPGQLGWVAFESERPERPIWIGDESSTIAADLVSNLAGVVAAGDTALDARVDVLEGTTDPVMIKYRRSTTFNNTTANAVVVVPLDTEVERHNTSGTTDFSISAGGVLIAQAGYYIITGRLTATNAVPPAGSFVCLRLGATNVIERMFFEQQVFASAEVVWQGYLAAAAVVYLGVFHSTQPMVWNMVTADGGTDPVSPSVTITRLKSGPTGPPGPTGPSGAGAMLGGGLAGKVLRKKTDTTLDVEWGGAIPMVTAFPSTPTTGDVVLVKQNTAFDGLWAWHGLAWYKDWNVAWGYLGHADISNSTTVGGTAAGYGPISWTFIQGRVYKVFCEVLFKAVYNGSFAAPLGVDAHLCAYAPGFGTYVSDFDFGRVGIYDTGSSNITASNGPYFHISGAVIMGPPASGYNGTASVYLKTNRFSGDGFYAQQGGNSVNRLWVEDMGPFPGYGPPV